MNRSGRMTVIHIEPRGAVGMRFEAFFRATNNTVESHLLFKPSRHGTWHWFKQRQGQNVDPCHLHKMPMFLLIIGHHRGHGRPETTHYCSCHMGPSDLATRASPHPNMLLWLSKLLSFFMRYLTSWSVIRGVSYAHSTRKKARAPEINRFAPITRRISGRALLQPTDEYFSVLSTLSLQDGKRVWREQMG